MTDTVLACLAEIKTMNIVALKGMWRDLYASEPPTSFASWCGRPR